MTIAVTVPGASIYLSEADLNVVLDALTDYHCALEEYTAGADTGTPEGSAAYLVRERASALMDLFRTKIAK